MINQRAPPASPTATDPNGCSTKCAVPRLDMLATSFRAEREREREIAAKKRKRHKKQMLGTRAAFDSPICCCSSPPYFPFVFFAFFCGNSLIDFRAFGRSPCGADHKCALCAAPDPNAPIPVFSTTQQFIERYVPLLKPLSQCPRLGEAMNLLHFHEVVLNLHRIPDRVCPVSTLFGGLDRCVRLPLDRVNGGCGRLMGVACARWFAGGRFQ